MCGSGLPLCFVVVYVRNCAVNVFLVRSFSVCSFLLMFDIYHTHIGNMFVHLHCCLYGCLCRMCK